MMTEHEQRLDVFFTTVCEKDHPIFADYRMLKAELHNLRKLKNQLSDKQQGVHDEC